MIVMEWIKKLTDIIMPLEPVPEEEEDAKELKKAEAKPADAQAEQNRQAKSAPQAQAEKQPTATTFANNLGGGTMSFTRNGGMISTAENGVTSMGGVRYEAYSSDTAVKPSLAVVKTPQLTMKIYAPTKYDGQVKQIADDLLKHNAVIVNFEGVDDIEQQRIGDFVIGAVYMINGRAEMVSSKIILYVPSGIEYETAAMTTASALRRYN